LLAWHSASQQIGEIGITVFDSQEGYEKSKEQT